ncbi:DUF1403 family protein [Mesorhizobium sp. M6A.T.Cr.TU.017.01.1.1]|uniref:DUF1403 family protein n=1 Tax=Mesorhizobium sp. M6A.T.Cr.TU.017.01.1.1 TaxID=2496774 RepID=UPI001FE09AEC|nr:DUF1403 family protein [Mesorhizobium sp. M6A.T.Cr.TU.017.01.1.1]
MRPAASASDPRTRVLSGRFAWRWLKPRRRSAGWPPSCRAERLIAVAPKLRAKGAGDVIFLLLNDDAVSGSLATKNLSRFAARRLFDRLQQLDAVRELSGRTTFRLFGL